MNHALITGSDSLVGQALALRLAARNVRVSILGSTEAETLSWWRTLAPRQRGEWHGVDLTDYAAVVSAVNSVNGLEPVDALATCIETTTRGTVLDADPESVVQAIAFSINETLMSAQAFARLLVSERRPGAVVMLSGTAGIGYVAGAGAADHAWKSAVVGLTSSLAGDLAKYGIRVNAVAPALVRLSVSEPERMQLAKGRFSVQAPAGRACEAEEVAAVIDWLLSPAASFTTGHTFPVDGGLTSVSVPLVGGYPSPTVDTREAGAL